MMPVFKSTATHTDDSSHTDSGLLAPKSWLDFHFPLQSIVSSEL